MPLFELALEATFHNKISDLATNNGSAKPDEVRGGSARCSVAYGRPLLNHSIDTAEPSGKAVLIEATVHFLKPKIKAEAICGWCNSGVSGRS